MKKIMLIVILSFGLLNASGDLRAVAWIVGETIESVDKTVNYVKNIDLNKTKNSAKKVMDKVKSEVIDSNFTKEMNQTKSSLKNKLNWIIKKIDNKTAPKEKEK